MDDNRPAERLLDMLGRKGVWLLYLALAVAGFYVVYIA